MVPDPAVGIDAAQTGARVLALSGDASKLLGAVRVDHTLRSAVGGSAHHVWLTVADTAVSNCPRGQRVAATRVGIAWVSFHRLNSCSGHKLEKGFF